MLSSIGTTRNAKRAALVHFAFNLIGAAVWLTVFCLVKTILAPIFLTQAADLMGIAVVHSMFNILCTLLMLPFSQVLEQMVCRILPDAKVPEKEKELDERLLGSPALALNQCRQVLSNMAELSIRAFRDSAACVLNYDKVIADRIREAENNTDHLEDLISTYLLKLTSRHLGDEESVKATEYLKLIGDYERIADHAVNILESAEEIVNKNVEFSDDAVDEYRTICAAVTEILNLSFSAFSEEDIEAARKTEPLEEVIDMLKEDLRTRHFLRLQRGECSVAGYQAVCRKDPHRITADDEADRRYY